MWSHSGNRYDILVLSAIAFLYGISASKLGCLIERIVPLAQIPPHSTPVFTPFLPFVPIPPLPPSDLSSSVQWWTSCTCILWQHYHFSCYMSLTAQSYGPCCTAGSCSLAAQCALWWSQNVTCHSFDISIHLSFWLQSPNKPTIPQEKIRPLTSLDHPQSPFYDPEGGSIKSVARVVIERIARKVSNQIEYCGNALALVL